LETRPSRSLLRWTAVHHEAYLRALSRPQGQWSRSMLITKPCVLALLCMTSAYASATGCTGSQKTSKEPLRGGVAEFRLTSYDGRGLEGRLLVHATDYDPLPIDRHLNLYDDALLEKVRACGKTDILPFQGPGPTWESYRRRRIHNNILTLDKDEWH